MHRRVKRMTTIGNRVLVQFVKDSNKPVKAKFTESILDSLGLITGNDLHIYGELKDGQMLLGNKRWVPQLKPIKMRRPSFCPIHNMSPAKRKELPDETRARGIDVGCAVILESADGKILLTRRAANLRTFPGVWVPPGGHVEFNETLEEAGLRELFEETGLKIDAKNCAKNNIPILAMWESAYPPLLSSGLPKRHHAVIYLYAKLTSDLSSESLQEQLRPDPSEVGATAWVDRKLIQAIVKATDDGANQMTVQRMAESLPPAISISVVQEDGSTVTEDLDTSILLQTAPGTEEDLERVSTGTKFALEEWLKMKH